MERGINAYKGVFERPHPLQILKSSKNSDFGAKIQIFEKRVKVNIFGAKIQIFIDFGVKIQIIEKLHISEKEHFGAKMRKFKYLKISTSYKLIFEIFCITIYSVDQNYLFERKLILRQKFIFWTENTF